jgi:hypothetical protein
MGCSSKKLWRDGLEKAFEKKLCSSWRRWGKTSGNCHVVAKEIVEGAGGSIPAGYEPPAAHPGLH